MTMPPTPQPKSGCTRVSLLSLVQLAICLLALWWAWRAWQNSEGAPIDRFWGAVALALFAGGLAQINLVGPLRERFSQMMSTSRLALPVRLYPDGSPQGLEWPMFSLALAFGPPFIPLLMLIFTAETKWMVELKLIWIGLALVSIFVAGVGLYLGGQALYKRLVGSQTIVEVEADTAQAEQTLQGFVWHKSGRIPSEGIEIALAGRKTFTKRIQSRSANSQSPWGSRTETTILHRQVICPATALDWASGPWQKHFSFSIPADALSSAPHTANPMIIWGLDVRVNLKGAPDFTLTFPFTVIGAPPEDVEPDEEMGETFDEMANETEKED